MMDILAWWWKGGGWCKDRGEKEEEVVNGENGVVKQWCDIKGVWIAEISGKGNKWNGCVCVCVHAFCKILVDLKVLDGYSSNIS